MVPGPLCRTVHSCIDEGVPVMVWIQECVGVPEQTCPGGRALLCFGLYQEAQNFIILLCK